MHNKTELTTYARVLIVMFMKSEFYTNPPLRRKLDLFRLALFAVEWDSCEILGARAREPFVCFLNIFCTAMMAIIVHGATIVRPSSVVSVCVLLCYVVHLLWLLSHRLYQHYSAVANQSINNQVLCCYFFIFFFGSDLC